MSERTNAGGVATRAVGTIAMSLAMFASTAQAQDTTSRHRVTVSASLGYILLGQSDGIEALLEAGGLGDVLQGGCRLGFCDSDEDYPVTPVDPGPGSNFRVAYSQWDRFEVAMTVGSSTPPRTEGYTSTSIPNFGSFAAVHSHVRLFAPTVNLRWQFAGIGVGPAYYRLSQRLTDQDEDFDESTTTKTGALVDGSGQFLLFKKLFLDLRVQYRFVGEADIGPLNAASYTIPPAPVDFSHLFFSFGLGLAF